MQAPITFKSADGYVLSIAGQRVTIYKGGRLLSVMRWESWERIHANLRMEGDIIAAGQLGAYC
jgi:hypothetical protein